MVPSLGLRSTQAYPKRKSQCKQRRDLLKFDIEAVLSFTPPPALKRSSDS